MRATHRKGDHKDLGLGALNAVAALRTAAQEQGLQAQHGQSVESQHQLGRREAPPLQLSFVQMTRLCDSDKSVIPRTVNYRFASLHARKDVGVCLP